MPTTVPPDWVSDSVFKSELARLESKAGVRQLERWRNEGLTPRAIQKGSEVWHSPSEARQALAVERVLAEKNWLDYAGTVLWAAGFDVDPKYWRPHLANADKWLNRIARLASRTLRRNDEADPDTPSDRIAALDLYAGVIHKISRRLPNGQFVTAVTVATQVMGGEFEGFDPSPSNRDDGAAKPIVERALDIDLGSDHAAGGHSLKLRDGIERALADLSATQGVAGLDAFTDLEIQNARDDMRNGLKIGLCLYEAVAWIYGPQAFGLRTAAFLARSAPIQLIFTMSVAFARLRRRSDEFYSSDEIAAMARQTEMTWLAAGYFRDLETTHPETLKIINADRLKLSFSDPNEQENLLKDLAGYEFPATNFRPWDQWKKLSKRTMPGGLLAMSIGSPPTLEIADIVHGASGDANP